SDHTYLLHQLNGYAAARAGQVPTGTAPQASPAGKSNGGEANCWTTTTYPHHCEKEHHHER
ncbi:hypothetical protein, partial [Arthrobacter sp. Bz4]|uniref:hypothetical protein n=2 Tax=unclassified Arthrobacter TaxID=235627 RepID=UPI001A9C4E57